MSKTAFQGQNDCQLPVGHDPAHIPGIQRQFHPLRIGFQDPVEGLDQSARLFDRVVVGVVRILDVEVLNGDVQPPLPSSRVIEGPRDLLLPGVDSLMYDCVHHVDMAVHDEGIVVQRQEVFHAFRWLREGSPGRGQWHRGHTQEDR